MQEEDKSCLEKVESIAAENKNLLLGEFKEDLEKSVN